MIFTALFRAGVRLLLLFLLGGCLGAVGSTISLPELQRELAEGDLIFQKSQSAQSEAIRQATGSDWTHVGVIVPGKGGYRVLEAAGRGVAPTSLADFVAKSEGRGIAVLRLQDAEGRITPEVRRKFQAVLRQDLGKKYDALFEWSDERIYCSELVWRAYKHSLGLSIGEVQTVGELEYQKPAVEALINERFRRKAAGSSREGLLQEKIITPAAMKKSNLLEIVFEGRVDG